MSNFLQFKCAFDLSDTEFPRLGDALVDDDIFDIIEDVMLPNDWELTETTISGAAGFVLIFDTYSIPLQEDMDAIEKVLRQLEAGL